MPGDDLAATHERELFKSFINSRRRDRFLSLLESAKGRKKILADLPHFNTDIFVHGQPVPSPQSNEQIAKLLTKAGSPRIVYVMSEDDKLDGKFLPLDVAISSIVGSQMGSFVSCIPGTLAYYEGEEPDTRFLLIRK